MKTSIFLRARQAIAHPCMLRRTVRASLPVKFLSSVQWKFSSTVSPTATPIDEEQNPDYDPKRFYPARIGEIIHRKYELVSKLGWGTGSTVWLARDVKRWPWQSTKYVALKIANCSEADRKSANEELEIYNHISSTASKHEGRLYVRQAQSSFAINGPSGEHLCMAFEPLREPLWLLGRHLGYVGLPPIVLKAFLRLVLLGLDFLHAECHIIHTDLKSDNLLVAFEDTSVIDDYVRQLEDHPVPYREQDGRRVYETRSDFGPIRKGIRLLKISDFGAAVFGNVHTPHNHDIQPQQFCAPEVLLKAGWSYSADIWNLGMVLWELLQDASLLDGLDRRSAEYSREAHFAQMIGLLGPPPQSLLDQADKGIYASLYNSRGEFRFPHLIPSRGFTFSDLTPSLRGEEKRLFIDFARRMLKWQPAQRSTAKELLDDPWFGCTPQLQRKAS